MQAQPCRKAEEPHTATEPVQTDFTLILQTSPNLVPFIIRGYINCWIWEFTLLHGSPCFKEKGLSKW
jgi:hypothetical protein